MILAGTAHTARRPADGAGMVRRGQVVTAVAAVLSPLVFALGAPYFPGGGSARVDRPAITDKRPLRSGYAPSPRGVKLWASPDGSPVKALKRTTNAAQAAALRKIAAQPQGIWLTEWMTPAMATSYVRRWTSGARTAGAVPVFVVYGIPARDCGGYSAGGLAGPAAYRAWIDGIAAGIGDARALVVLEPDALALMDCLSPQLQKDRTAMLSYAVDTLGRNGSVSVYLDAGHSRWHSAAVIAPRLRAAGVLRARGFALNVSAFDPTGPEIAYGKEIGVQLGNPVPFVVDTSRNGRGRGDGPMGWCNPPGRALGSRPTTTYADPLVDALLWVKIPGESDGGCNGGPPAGRWWQDYAVGLASRAAW